MDYMDNEEEYKILEPGDIRPQCWEWTYYDGPWQSGIGLVGIKISPGNTGMRFRVKFDNGLSTLEYRGFIPDYNSVKSYKQE